jgi:uncharacterized protein YbjQ (UPF0145 family)
MFELILTAAALAVAYCTGRYIERRHYRSIEEREAAQAESPVPMVSLPLSADDFSNQPIREVRLLTASVVLGSDYFRGTLAKFLSFIGGRVGVMENLLDRARREAVLRLQKQADGADYLLNVRYETAFLDNPQQSKIPKVEVMAYGTAVYLSA